GRRARGPGRRMGRRAPAAARRRGRRALRSAVGSPVVTFLDVAALGTSRQQGGVPATGTPVDALTQSLDSVAAAGDERSVLLRAGALAVYHRAGRRPEAAIHPPERAPVDRLPEPPPQVARLLRELTHSGPRDLRSEERRVGKECGFRWYPHFQRKIIGKGRGWTCLFERPLQSSC